MPYINIIYKREFKKGYSGYTEHISTYIKKRVYFDIIGKFPPIPLLPSLGKINDGDFELYFKKSGFRGKRIPFSHPLNVVIGESAKNMREFSIQLYAFPNISHTAICNEESYLGDKYSIHWNLGRKDENGFFKIWSIKKYKKLLLTFNKRAFLPEDYTFLAHIFVLTSPLGEKTVNTPVLKTQLLECIFSKEEREKYIHDTIEFPQWFEDYNKSPSFFIPKKKGFTWSGENMLYPIEKSKLKKGK